MRGLHAKIFENHSIDDMMPGEYGRINETQFMIKVTNER